MRDAWIVFDLGFGDAGKGATVDFLVRDRGADLVVRHHGGAQAGHNVVTPDGRHHTFSQFGSGTFVPGTRTLLGPEFVMHPGAMRMEAAALARAGIDDAFERTAIDERALVISPFHQAANRLRELARGDQAHGSCGIGFGEAVGDSLSGHDDTIRAGDLIASGSLGDDTSLRAKLASQQRRKRDEFARVRLPNDMRVTGNIGLLKADDAVERTLALWRPLRQRLRIIAADETHRLIRDARGVVFEGAQGVLLDQDRGFHPHTTWSDCTPAGALRMLEAAHRNRRAGTLPADRDGSAGTLPAPRDGISGTLPAPRDGIAGTLPVGADRRTGLRPVQQCSQDVPFAEQRLARNQFSPATVIAHRPDGSKTRPTAGTRLAVIRAYVVRHGAGPFPTHDPDFDRRLIEPHNDDKGWQGRFRRGPLDLVLLRYALVASGGADALAITCLDQVGDTVAVCREYEIAPSDDASFDTTLDGNEMITGAVAQGNPASGDATTSSTSTVRNTTSVIANVARRLATRLPVPAPGDHAALERLGESLRSRVKPVIESIPRDRLVPLLESELGIPVRLISEGPTAAHRRWVG